MTTQLLLLLVLSCALVGLFGQTHGVQGPVFLQEPPSTLVFSNTSGSQVSCSVHGSPTPQVDWILQDGNTVSAVPGLRQSLGNGTLYFPPFRAQDYRKDVHSTVYRCRASNLVGTILSKDVNVRAVVRQHYEVQVHRAHVLIGNTAVLSCVIPPYVKDHVTVTSWFRDDSILLPGRADMGGRYVVTSGNGDLHIRAARPEDGIARYSCLTLHSLTHERKRSAPATLTVTEATGSMPPRLSPRTLTAISAERGSDVHLSCSSQGNPPPVFIWFRESEGQLQSIAPSTRVIPTNDILYIRRVEPEDTGRWSCKASNQFGEQKLDIHLTVTAHLTVHVMPQLQVINFGKSATFNCTISGSPVSSVQWLRNGDPLLTGNGADERIKELSPLVLSVQSVTRHDRGMYQCVVRNERESAQGSAELRLGDTIPELQYTFIEQALRPGPQVSLRCAATGSPPPQFKWLLDGEPLSEISAGHRYAIGQYVDQSGDVISHLNITNVRVEDGGLYSCRAVNSLGSAAHSARLNIYGPPFIRSIGPIQAVAGADITLHCPYSGHPISGVRWEHRGQELPLDLRHQIKDTKVGGALVISRLDSVTDSGRYTCTVTNRNGEFANRDIQLIVHSPPILEPFSFPSSLQEGSRAQVTCSVTSGDMPILFNWYKDNAPVSASLQIEERAAEFFSMLIFKEVTSRHSGFYTCVASNNAAKANYTAQLMVKVAPQWVQEPHDMSTLVGNSIMVNCEAKGFPHPQIQWLKGQAKTSSDYQPLQNVRSRILLLSNGSIWMDSVSASAEGHYLCRATNGIGAGLGKVIYIGVNEPVRFDVPSKNISAKRGEPSFLICHVFGDTPIENIWYRNGNRLDLSNYRFSITEIKMDTGLKSQLSISRSVREDSGTYKCQAENAFGRTEHIIYYAVQERPDPPAMLEVIEVGSRFVRLSWKRPFDGNSPVLGYMVQYRPHGSGHTNGDWDPAKALNITLPVTLGGTTSSAIDFKETALVGGLLPATTYDMRMLAINNIDHSFFTEPVVVKTQEEAPVEAPLNLHVKAVGQGELYLTWQPPAKENWNGELLGYVVTWQEQGTPKNVSKSMTVKGWATSKLQLTGLRKYTKYDVQLRAYNSVSAGPTTQPVSGTTMEGVPEAPPQNVACSQISSTSMKISWESPPAWQHGGKIQGYKVFYRPVANDDMEMPTSAEVKRTSSSETYLHALYKFTNYSIQALAFTNAGEGVMSLPLFCTTEEDVPGPPANIKASALTDESILVSWLAPTKQNGNIKSYTVYIREVGRVGQHTSYTVRMEDSVNPIGLMFEVRNLKEHQLYEFWVSATTGIGEGEPTPIVAQDTVIKAPSRIASFSQIVHKAVNAKIILPCYAVGNPTPRTRWFHRDRPITFSPFYEVTADGHLNIHSADSSLSGNYTCTAKNLFGEDEITYSLVVLLPPGSPNLEVQFTTSQTIRVKWTPPDDGGTAIQGYTMRFKQGSDTWKTIELSGETSTYTFEELQCGSIYHIYVVAHNRVGNGNPSQITSVSTKGGPPLIAKDKDLLISNATMIHLNLFIWPDGGCPINHYSIEYKALSSKEWSLVSTSVSDDKLYIQDLLPATWYQVKISANNDAGKISRVYNIATTTLLGDKIPFPPEYLDNAKSKSSTSLELYITLAIGGSVFGLICGILWYFYHAKRRNSHNKNDREEEESDDKNAETENRRNCQQVYTSSPVKIDNGPKLNSMQGSGMYEISPYATFSVPGSRSVTTSTLDYTMQFKTFGHLENDENNAVYPKPPDKRTWHKHRYYNTENHRSRHQNVRHLREELPPHRTDSESDASDPFNECSGSGGNYRVPVKSARDLFRPDSSTDSNEMSPMAERRHTPRHLGATPRRHERHRPVSTSSSEELSANDAGAGIGVGADGGEESMAVVGAGPEGRCTLRLQPPSGFSDSRELSEAECDRESSALQPCTGKLPVELAALLSRYQEGKEQDRKEFTIHV